jgi:hypothetical protein
MGIKRLILPTQVKKTMEARSNVLFFNPKIDNLNGRKRSSERHSPSSIKVRDAFSAQVCHETAKFDLIHEVFSG